MSGPHGLWSERSPPGLPAKMLPWYTLPCPARPQLLATDPSMMFHPRLPAPRAVAFSHGALAPASPDSAGFRCFSRVTSLYRQVWSSHSPAVGPSPAERQLGRVARGLDQGPGGRVGVPVQPPIFCGNLENSQPLLGGPDKETSKALSSVSPSVN